MKPKHPKPVDRRTRVGDYLVPYDDATTEVTLQRSFRDVLTAKPGDDQNCMNSNCIIRSQREENAFPHNVYLVSTILTRVYIVDQLDASGQPAHAVRYELSKRDSDLINNHDKHGVGEVGELRLRVPADPKGSPRRAANAAKAGGGKRFSQGGGNGNRPGSSYSGKKSKPVTSVGAQARMKVAVGALLAD